MEQIPQREYVRQSAGRHELGRRSVARTTYVVQRNNGPAPEIPDEIAAIPAEKDKEWRQYAGCASADPELFFPEKGGNAKEAKQICADCRVQSQCLEYALMNDEKFGIWGNTTRNERMTLRARRKKRT